MLENLMDAVRAEFPVTEKENAVRSFRAMGMLYAGLGRVAMKMKKPAAVTLLAVSFVFSLGMGYLASRDFAQPVMNWMAELVNIVAQGSLFAAALILHRSGLAEGRASRRNHPEVM